jgi:hypothetical protein
MDYPVWITAQYLGSYQQDHSFDLEPLVIAFSANLGSTVSLLNGYLPDGLSWTQDGNTVVISGVAIPKPSEISARFTFRIKQSNGGIADRTYVIDLTPIALPPSWANQPSFLGYQGNVTPVGYQLVAIPPAGQYVSYTLLTPITGMDVDQITGLLTYNAAVETSNVTKNMTVRASTGLADGDVDLSVSVVISPLAPRWVTSSGALENPIGGENFPGNEFIEIILEATEVTGAEITYSFQTVSTGFPLELSTSGTLFGRPPDPVSETTYSFSITASSPNGSSTRNFTITIVPSEEFSLLSWTSGEDLGSIDEGRYIDLKIRATTLRKSLILYYVTGGMLPPHLMLDVATGRLVGFCEYHAVAKTYMFDVTITDGVQTKTRQFVLRVNKIYGDQFFSAYIPVTGELRNQWAINASNVKARGPGTVVFNHITDLIDPPYLSIVDGVITGYSTPDQIVSNAMPWFHTLDLQFGQSSNTSVTSDGTSILYRNVVDQQQGANVSVYSNAVYNTNPSTNGMVYPISISNLRQALVGQNGFIGSGSGSGLVLLPTIDWSDGSLSSVEVVNSGYGYRSRPTILVSGSGSGAEVVAILGLISASLDDAGQGWQVGDTASIPGYSATSSATLEITSVGPNGEIIGFSVTNAGDYLQVSSSPVLTITIGSAVASLQVAWGVISIQVISKGIGYQCGISLGTQGGEILPPWQDSYAPVMEIGQIPIVVASHAADLLDQGADSLWGIPWQPNYIVFQWQGLRWLGSTTFDSDLTTFDGGTTRWQETEDASVTVFDGDLTVFNDGNTVFDHRDPLEYDLFQVWGGTLIDAGTTVFDLYRTIFDVLPPRRRSNTVVTKWIGMQNRIYSGNNAVW